MTTESPEAPPREPLTDRQRAVYDWIVEFCQDKGYSPTVRELCRAFGFHSTNAAVCHLRPLARKGYVRWQPRAQRTLRPVGGLK